MPSYIVNLFGDCLRYWICDLKDETYKYIFNHKIEFDKSWEEMFFDLDFLNTIGFNHWSELSNYDEFRGFLISKNNRIEVKGKTKKVLKLNSIDLLNQKTLFPLFQVSKIQMYLPVNELKRFILIHFEIGQFAKYKIECDSFNVDKLEFKLITCPMINLDFILAGIDYEGVNLINIDEETLVKKMLVIDIT